MSSTPPDTTDAELRAFIDDLREAAQPHGDAVIAEVDETIAGAERDMRTAAALIPHLGALRRRILALRLCALIADLRATVP